jgi:RHS repeat-associated protein
LSINCILSKKTSRRYNRVILGVNTPATSQFIPGALPGTGSIRVAIRVVDGAANPTYWLLNDQLGSTAITSLSPDAFSGTDASGALTAELRFKAWGEQRYASGSTPTTYRYTGQREQSQLSIYFYGARWYDPQLSRFLQPDTVIPDLQNSLDWDRFAYVRNNPVRYNDPTGHVCSDPEDPNPTCEKAGTTKLKKVSYKIDKDNLTKGGRRAYELYRKARNNPGWWNNNKSGTLTVEQFYGIFVLHEAGGQGPTLPWIKAVSGNRLFLPTPDNFGAKPYCTGDLCRNGMFNFMAAYQGYGKYGETSKLVT